MGFFDDLAEAAFKKGADGSDIYYSSGVLEKGRVVLDAERRKKLFTYHKRVYKYATPLFVLYGAAVGFGSFTWSHLVFIGVVLILLIARQRYLISGLPTYGEKLKASEAVTKGAKAFHPALLVISGVISLLLIAGGAAIPVVFGLPVKEILYPILGIVCMGSLGLALSVYLYRARKSNGAFEGTHVKPRAPQRGR